MFFLHSLNVALLFSQGYFYSSFKKRYHQVFLQLPKIHSGIATRIYSILSFKISSLKILTFLIFQESVKKVIQEFYQAFLKVFLQKCSNHFRNSTEYSFNNLPRIALDILPKISSGIIVAPH